MNVVYRTKQIFLKYVIYKDTSKNVLMYKITLKLVHYLSIGKPFVPY